MLSQILIISRHLVFFVGMTGVENESDFLLALGLEKNYNICA